MALEKASLAMCLAGSMAPTTAVAWVDSKAGRTVIDLEAKLVDRQEIWTVVRLVVRWVADSAE